VLEVLRRRHRHSACRGRYGTPAEVVLRLLVLKHLRQWSYAQVVREVAGSIVYRRFCRVEAGKVPDDKTLIKLGKVEVEPATVVADAGHREFQYDFRKAVLWHLAHDGIRLDRSKTNSVPQSVHVSLPGPETSPVLKARASSDLAAQP
jgi:hypothetical protein